MVSNIVVTPWTNVICYFISLLHDVHVFLYVFILTPVAVKAAFLVIVVRITAGDIWKRSVYFSWWQKSNLSDVHPNMHYSYSLIRCTGMHYFLKKKKMYRQNIYLVKRPVPIPREVFSVSLKRQQYERSLSRHTESLTAVTHQRKKESRHTTMHSTRTQNSLCTIENLSDKSFWNTYKTFSFFYPQTDINCH